MLADNAGTNKAASSSTSFNTKKLDEDSENLARELSWFANYFDVSIFRFDFLLECFFFFGSIVT